MAFDPASGRTRVLRLKENADDYRYFPDPDLVPLVIEPERIEAAKAQLPELADAKRQRFQQEHGLSEYDARLLTESRALGEFFEATLAHHGTAKTVANWLLRDLLRALSEQQLEIEDAGITPDSLAALLALVDQGRTTAQSARGLLPELVKSGGDPEQLVRERGLEAVSDAGVLESAVDAVIAANPDNVARYQEGEKKVLNFFMGQVMKQTGGKADPAAVREILARKLEG
jgi:aspartyl-tRNA(Asn)/glutamyl-tRNA(Gln) amidotransferase subunit B